MKSRLASTSREPVKQSVVAFQPPGVWQTLTRQARARLEGLWPVGDGPIAMEETGPGSGREGVAVAAMEARAAMGARVATEARAAVAAAAAVAAVAAVETTTGA